MRMATRRYYRSQPAGLNVAGHYSETSTNELADGLHVFSTPYEVIDGADGIYGDEIVEIEAEREWSNGDVEGVCVDPDTARITRRWTVSEFRTLFAGLPLDEYGLPPTVMP
jgi:hypothetical protein